ncbi:hypothetical protein [Fictibacillus phosphorivorans]|nr:hypothetical protein [Fictibacillus phosphorivorans]
MQQSGALIQEGLTHFLMNLLNKQAGWKMIYEAGESMKLNKKIQEIY